MSTVSDLLACFIPTDFLSRFVDLLKAEETPVTTWQPGDPTRTNVAVMAATLAIGYGLPGNQQLVESTGDATKWGSILTYAYGGLLKFASLVSDDPSVVLADGTYPVFGISFLDSVADGIFNCQRTGGPISGPSAESNAALVARCVAKQEKVGVTIARQQTDPYTMYATSRYAGTTLSAPVTRVAALSFPATGTVNVFLATATGPSSAPDVALVDAFLQATCVPWTVTMVTSAALGVAAGVVCSVRVPARYSDVAATDVQKVVDAYTSSVPIGGFPNVAGGSNGISKEGLVAAIFEGVTYVEDVFGLTIGGSPTDLVMGPADVPISVAATVTVVLT